MELKQIVNLYRWTDEMDLIGDAEIVKLTKTQIHALCKDNVIRKFTNEGGTKKLEGKGIYRGYYIEVKEG
ncbi:MAG TPA: hypothetical protein VIM70_11250 [Clostridium sp.]|uniref:hypothetical protein n=1 Tax=Clostridium sp. TaxID=1506 RepID=UPI002F9444BA